MDGLSLRGHHLLCLLGYRGYGYSREHEEKLWQMKRLLWSSPETVVKIEDRPDGVCHSCPHLKDGACAREAGSEVRVRGRDQRVMARLGLSSGERLAWGGVVERLRARVTPEDLAQLCSACSWLPLGYCLEGLKSIRGKDV